MNTYYVGSYGIVPLAVDTHRENVEFYLKHTRRLKKGDYRIRAQKLDDATAYTHFEREMMQKYDGKHLLPHRDCDAIDDRIEGLFKQLSTACVTLQTFGVLSANTKFKEDIVEMQKAFQLLLRIGTKNKRRSSYEEAIILTSPIFTMDINEYLRFIKQDTERLQYERMWRMRVDDGELFDKR